MADYHRPVSLDEALAALARPWTVLAGGTDFYPARVGRAIDENVLDITAIADLRGISAGPEGWRLGATTTWTELIETPLPPLFDGLKQAARDVGGRQIQNAGTIAGNLCNASPAADSVPALVAAGATVTIQGPKGKRQLPVEQFCSGPGKTTLKNGEILVSIALPKRPKNASDAYLRLIPRTEMDIAVVGCGVSLTMKGDTVADARVSLGAVAPTVLVVDKAAKALIGSKLDDAALEAAAKACSDACKPIDDKRGTIRYRTKIAGVLLKRAAMIARDRINGIEHHGHR